MLLLKSKANRVLETLEPPREGWEALWQAHPGWERRCYHAAARSLLRLQDRWRDLGRAVSRWVRVASDLPAELQLVVQNEVDELRRRIRTADAEARAAVRTAQLQQ